MLNGRRRPGNSYYYDDNQHSESNRAIKEEDDTELRKLRRIAKKIKENHKDRIKTQKLTIFRV